MTDQDFHQLVSYMRNHQREYFKHKEREHLQASKHYEKQVDAELKRYAKEQDDKQQPKLF